MSRNISNNAFSKGTVASMVSQERFTGVFKVDPAYVAPLIGKAGANTKRIISTVRQGCYIDGRKDGEFHISAYTPQAVQQAAKMLKIDLESLKNPKLPPTKPSAILPIDAEFIPVLIGKAGAGLRAIETQIGDGCYLVVIDGELHVRADTEPGLRRAIDAVQREIRRIKEPAMAPPVFIAPQPEPARDIAPTCPKLSVKTSIKPKFESNRFTVFSFDDSTDSAQPEEESPQSSESWSDRVMRECWGEPAKCGVNWADSLPKHPQMASPFDGTTITPREPRTTSYASKVSNGKSNGNSAEPKRAVVEEFPALAPIKKPAVKTIWARDEHIRESFADPSKVVFTESPAMIAARLANEEAIKAKKREDARKRTVDLSDIFDTEESTEEEDTQDIQESAVSLSVQKKKTGKTASFGSTLKSFIKNTSFKGNWAEQDYESDNSDSDSDE